MGSCSVSVSNEVAKRNYEHPQAPSLGDAAARDTAPRRTRRGGVGVRRVVSRLNGYLADAPEMSRGFKRADGVILLLSPEGHADDMSDACTVEW